VSVLSADSLRHNQSLPSRRQSAATCLGCEAGASRWATIRYALDQQPHGASLRDHASGRFPPLRWPCWSVSTIRAKLISLLVSAERGLPSRHFWEQGNGAESWSSRQDVIRRSRTGTIEQLPSRARRSVLERRTLLSYQVASASAQCAGDRQPDQE
jgi:hypothetical protein